MKHGKRPTVRQKKLMRELGINNDSWLMGVRDDDIIKALECCQVGESCKGCPSQGKFGKDAMCPHLNMLAADLINRQKAEIEKLRRKNSELEKANESFSCMGMLYSEIKSEARKEIWEQIKAMYGLDENDIIVAVNIKEIDNLLAEMEREGK